MRINEKMDEGDILETYEIAIEPTDNLATLSEKLGNLSGKSITHYIENVIKQGNIKQTPQNPEDATYTRLLTNHDRKITNNDNSVSAYNKIGHLPPSPAHS